MYTFSTLLEIIGINPYVSVPDDILSRIFNKAGKDRGTIPIHGTVNGNAYTQTLVRYKGAWRLYVNTTMLKNSPKRIGETLTVTIDFDHRDRALPIHPKLNEALEQDAHARSVFESLSPSHRHEINRYITNLKSAAKVDENVQKAIGYLHGNGKFVGRELTKK
jgi:hypothetical protein